MKTSEAQMELVRRYLSGEATQEETQSLGALLLSDPQVRRDFLAYARIDAALSAAARPQLQVAGVAAPRQQLSWTRWLPLAAAAMLMAAGLTIWLWPPSLPDLGTVTQVLDAEFSGDDKVPHVGQRLGAGRRLLVRGAVAMTLSNGVTILHEGPGELELLTPMHAVLHSGQVVVRVPQNAIGFQLDCASVRVVDLGTEFAVKAGPALETDVQVFEGEIVATSTQGGFPSHMKAGKAARFSPATKAVPETLEYSDSRFLRRLPPDPGVPVPATRKKLEFREARHEEVVIPATVSEIRIDGDLSDWNDEGRFASTLDDARSVEGRMRHDADAFYLAAHIKDPAPMRNVISPDADGELGWKGGGLQVRLGLNRKQGWPIDASSPGYYRTRKLAANADQIARGSDDRIAHLTFWHHAPTGRDCLYLTFGLDYHGGIVNPPGYTAAFKRDADGAGYTIEALVPWALLHAADDPPRAGDVLAVCWNTHWSDPSGRLPLANLVELRNPAEPLRIFDYERAATWGRALYR